MARTAAVVGTATATRNAVNRRQAEKNMAAYQNAAAATAPQQQVVYADPSPQPEYIPAQAPAAQEDVVTQLERLGALKQQGLLTDEEFAAQKAKLLGL
jgi:predicted transposase YdaD